MLLIWFSFSIYLLYNKNTQVKWDVAQYVDYNQQLTIIKNIQKNVCSNYFLN